MSSFPAKHVQPCFYAGRIRYYPSYHSLQVLSSYIKECIPNASVYIHGVDSLRSVLETQLKYNNIKIRQKWNPTSCVLLMTEHIKNCGEPYAGPIRDALANADGRPVFLFTPLKAAIYAIPQMGLKYWSMSLISTASNLVLTSERNLNSVTEELRPMSDKFVWVAFNVQAPIHFDSQYAEAHVADTVMKRFYDTSHVESVTHMQHGRNPSCIAKQE